jgi:hypothetical protein
MKGFWVVLLFLLLPLGTKAQSATTPRYTAVPLYWYSLNSTFSKSSWLLLADLHYRHQAQPISTDFWFARIGFGHGWSQGYKLIGGYAHLWRPISNFDQSYLDENRLYLEGSYIKKSRFISMFYRFRWEHRFIEGITENEMETFYRQRYRFLLSATFYVSKSNDLPAPVIANELLLQTGEGIQSNFLDQNRLFIGLRQRVSKALSFDIGYMPVLKTTSTTGVYELQNTFRWFWYLNISAGENKKDHSPIEGAE